MAIMDDLHSNTVSISSFSISFSETYIIIESRVLNKVVFVLMNTNCMHFFFVRTSNLWAEAECS